MVFVFTARLLSLRSARPWLPKWSKCHVRTAASKSRTSTTTAEQSPLTTGGTDDPPRGRNRLRPDRHGRPRVLLSEVATVSLEHTCKHGKVGFCRDCQAESISKYS